MAELGSRDTVGRRVRSKSIVHVMTVPISLVFVDSQIPLLKQQGFDVHVISSPDQELETFRARHRIATHGVRMYRRISPLRDVYAVARLYLLLRKIRPTIVHAHTPKAGLLAMLAARAAGTPARIYHMRGLPLVEARSLKRRILRLAERTTCALAHRVFCVSHSLRDVALAERIGTPEKLCVLANGSGQGVDAIHRFNPELLEPHAAHDTRTRFGIPEEALVIGFIGRLVQSKGISELAAAWTSLRGRHTNVHMLLVGPFEQEDPVAETSIAELQADSRVHFAGLDWNTPPLFAAMDIFVLPTYREGFPNVLLEAAAMELPVVATRVLGCVDAVQEGVTGILIPAKNVSALAEALDRYISSAPERRAHGEQGRARVLREFDPESIREALFSEYESLLQERLGYVPLAH